MTATPSPDPIKSAEPTTERAIWYDMSQRRQAFLDLLDLFEEDLAAEQMRNTLGRDALAQLRARGQHIRERLSAPFSLVVMGDFKRGKSTLVNALLGLELATMNITPETITINEIRYGDELRIQAQLVDGGRVNLSADELRADRLGPLLQLLPQSVSHLSIEAPVEWLRGIVLVDVPGTGDLEWRFEQQVQAYLPRADAIIYVVSALAPLSASEQAFMRLALMPQEFPKLLFAVNMIDSIRSDRDAERVIDMVRARIDGIFPRAAVFGISALDELCRALGWNRPNRKRAAVLEQAFAEFRATLDETILLNRDIIQLDRAIAQMASMLGNFEQMVERLRQAMQQDQEDLRAAITECEDHTSELHRTIAQRRSDARATITSLGAQASEWMDDFFNRVEAEVIGKLSQFALADVQRHFHFFFSDALSVALNHCIEAHQPIIAAVLDRARLAIQHDVDDSVASAPMSAADVSRLAAPLTFNQAAWNSLDMLQMLAAHVQTQIFGFVGNLMVHGALALLDRKVDDPRQLQSYQQSLRSAIPELRNVIHAEIAQLYTTMAQQVDQQIDVAYQEDIELSLTTMRQAQTIHADGAQRVVAVKRTCSEMLELATDIRARSETIQRALWSERLVG